MRRAAALLLCMPLLMGAAAKPPSTRCALVKYFDAHETACAKTKARKPHAAKTAAAKPHAGHVKSGDVKHDVTAAAKPRAKDTKAEAAKPGAAKPRAVAAKPALNDNTDTSHAIPAKDALKLPSTKEQFDALKHQIVRDRPQVTEAKAKSDKLKAEAAALQRKLIATAARVQALESEKARLDADIQRLAREDKRLSASFARDRVSVARLLALLERMQHDMPPAIVLRPDDALGAARSAMLIGASVPHVYAEAAALSRRIRALKETREKLVARRAEGVRNAGQLRGARAELDQLLATKQLEADAASSRYGDLEARLEKAAVTAADLQSLLDKVASLRGRPEQRDIVEVAAEKTAPPHALLVPVVGRQVQGGLEGVGGARAPGLTFATAPGARVIAPADCEVIFAGPYHKTGQVLILEITAGYDLVLAGLDRVDVRPHDMLLAGEPIGTMPVSVKPNSVREMRLYFELRQNGHGSSPAPWLSVELRKAQKS